MASITITTAILAYLGSAGFAARLVLAGNYGYFRDEVYYIESGTQHLSGVSRHSADYGPHRSIPRHRFRGTRSSQFMSRMALPKRDTTI
jgi:hypothetical protein